MITEGTTIPETPPTADSWAPSMGIPGQGSEVHTISPEIQVLQKEGPERPQSAFPLPPCVPAPRGKRPGCGVHRTEEEPEGLRSKASCPTSHVEFVSDQGFSPSLPPPVPPSTSSLTPPGTVLLSVPWFYCLDKKKSPFCNFIPLIFIRHCRDGFEQFFWAS